MPVSPLDRIRADYDDFCYGSSERYAEWLPQGLRDLAYTIAFMSATTEFVTPDALAAIYSRTEALLRADRVIAKHERAVGG